MFNKVKKRLALFNSILMGILLLLFVTITFCWSTWVIYSGEKENLLSYAEEEANELDDEEELDEIDDDDDGLMFNYFFDTNGNLIHYENPSSELSQVIWEKIKNWKVPSEKPGLFFSKYNNQTLVTLIIAMPVIKANNLYGIFYAGKDVSMHYSFIKKLLYILIGLFIMFIALITCIGYYMADRSIEHIKSSYQRQRQFLADASHELRLPLSVLLSSVEVIENDDENQFSNFTKQILSDMKDEIKKMSFIIGNLLTLARSNTTASDLIKEHFNVKPIAEQIVRILEPIAQTKNIELELNIPENTVIYADKERISQLLQIFLDNAIKYTDNNGRIQLFIETPVTSPPLLKIIVKDNGVGIAPEEQDLIFERFYRVDKARSRNIQGTGLGLSIAKWIVEAHKGSIKVVSQPGKGSSFIVTIPQ